MRTSHGVALAAFALAACSKPSATIEPPSGTAPSAAGATVAPSPSAPAADLPLEVMFSSEKKDWAVEAIARFEDGHPKTSGGRSIRVHATYGGSIEPIEAIVHGTLKVHVFSPASSLVVPLLNDAWRAAQGAGAQPIASKFEPLILSPVVIAMWDPMARALGWPEKKIGWSEVATLARTTDAWKARGHAEWGAFRFGHTHPGYSNSGLIAVIAETYAGAGKQRDLAADDVTAPKSLEFVRSIEGSVVHYGRSTGFFFDALADHGPAYLSAAVLYENLVVTATDAAQKRGKSLPFLLVSLYPREGTQWADHPYVVLDAPWVGVAEKQAAQQLGAFLMSRPMQELALTKYGFRPALTDVPLGAPIDAAHGADPHEPQTLLPLPTVPVVRSILDTWRDKTKRGVDIVIVVDRSGSMNGARITGARLGLNAFLASLRPTDTASMFTFSEKLDPVSPIGPPSALTPRVNAMFASGGTALYDAVLAGQQLATSHVKTDRTHIHAVVVLTDGEDRDSVITYNDLLAKLGGADEGAGGGADVRVFTIGYGAEANEAILKGIATKTGGAYFHGDPDNIRAIYDEIASFF